MIMDADNKDIRAKTADLQAADAQLAAEVARRKKAEAALLASEAHFRQVLENSADASYMRNLQTNSYEYLSPVFTEVSGYTPEEMISLPIEAVIALIHPDDLSEIDRVITESMSGPANTSYQVEYRFQHKNGGYHWLLDRFTVLLDATGLPLARIGSVSDITERKAAEKALHDSEVRFRKLFEENKTTMLIIDPDTGNIVQANKAAADFYGWPVEQLMQMRIHDINTLTSAGVQNQMEKLKKTGSLLYDFQHRLEDGSIREVEVSSSRIEIHGKVYFYSIVYDITERKLAREELQKAHDELEQRVLRRTADLEKTNATLAMMLDYARKTEADIKERVVASLRANILSITDALKKQQLSASVQDLVELLETSTRDLAHPLSRNLESQLLKLTAREMQLANFIRLGKSTKEMMVLLNLSAKTIETHRNNLRRKLGLRHKKINLRTFLNSEFGE